MWLNCDLGESFGSWKMPVEEAVMEVIDQANIACGFHAGDPVTLQQALRLAVAHQVQIGAHPAYPDLQGFGRRSMQLSESELIGCIQYQVSALQGLATLAGGQLTYVKPHGALYNDMMKNTVLRGQVFRAVAQFSNPSLALMIQAHPDHAIFQAEADALGLSLYFEAFADRRYTDEGWLTPRSQSNAVLNHDEAVAQARQLIEQGTITTEHGQILTCPVDSLCVHGDSPDAVEMATHIRQLLPR